MGRNTVRARQRQAKCVGGVVAVGAVLAAILPAPAGVAADEESTDELGVIEFNRDTYRDRLHAMWLGQSIANWTGLQTEFDREEPPFYTDDDWPGIGFVTDQDPWLADDDTDIEYVYLHAASQAGTPALTSQQIADAWERHINNFIWVSNAKARQLMREGAVPPATGLGMANEHSLAIDAQLTTEFFGSFAPAMPREALRIADLPIRTTAEGHASHASQFFALLYALAPTVEHLPPQDQPMALADAARKYIPDTSKAADIVDFVVADFQTNPDIDDWESTRDRIYRRYQLNAEENGFNYRGGVESSINFAAGVMTLLFGGGDYKRTVQIGTMSGWDSDNATATLGGLIGLLRGTEYIREQFPDVDLSDRYNIYRTRDELPDYLPQDADAEDTFAAMAERMLPLVERAIVDAGGSVDGNAWTIPAQGPAPDPSDIESLATVNPGSDLLRRSANNQIRQAGDDVVATSSLNGTEIDGGSADVAVIADGAESDFTGAERFERPRFFTATGAGKARLSVTYGRIWAADTVRIITGPAGEGGGLSDAAVELRTPEGRWVKPPSGTYGTAELRGDTPYQVVDVHLGRTEQLTGVRVVGKVAKGDRLAVAEIDALAPAKHAATPDGPVTATPRIASALPGTTVDVTVDVPNTGTKRWDGTVALSIPDGWSASPERIEIRHLKPGDTASHTFAVRVPESAATCNANIHATADISGVDLPPTTSRVVVIGDQVQTVEAHGLVGNTIELSWAGVDPDSAATFRIYGSTDPEFVPGPDTLRGESAELEFRHLGLVVNSTWYYRIVPVDSAGNEGTPSDPVSATAGSRYLIEAEHLLPPVEATKPAVHQSNCCGVVWSNDGQIWFQSNNGGPGDYITLSFTMPDEGTFELVTTYTKAWDFGIHQLAVDGEALGQPFDAYSPDVQVHDVNHGPIHLTEGEHTLTLTVTGKNENAGGLGLGIDTLELIPA